MLVRIGDVAVEDRIPVVVDERLTVLVESSLARIVQDLVVAVVGRGNSRISGEVGVALLGTNGRPLHLCGDRGRSVGLGASIVVGGVFVRRSDDIGVKTHVRHIVLSGMLVLSGVRINSVLMALNRRAVVLLLSEVHMILLNELGGRLLLLVDLLRMLLGSDRLLCGMLGRLRNLRLLVDALVVGASREVGMRGPLVIDLLMPFGLLLLRLMLSSLGMRHMLCLVVHGPVVAVLIEEHRLGARGNREDDWQFAEHFL